MWELLTLSCKAFHDIFPWHPRSGVIALSKFFSHCSLTWIVTCSSLNPKDVLPLSLSRSTPQLEIPDLPDPVQMPPVLGVLPYFPPTRTWKWSFYCVATQSTFYVPATLNVIVIDVSGVSNLLTISSLKAEKVSHDSLNLHIHCIGWSTQ